MRLQWVVIGVVLFVSLLGEGQDAMFRGNVQHDGIYEVAGVPKFRKMKWSFHIGAWGDPGSASRGWE